MLPGFHGLLYQWHGVHEYNESRRLRCHVYIAASYVQVMSVIVLAYGDDLTAETTVRDNKPQISRSKDDGEAHGRRWER